MTAVCGKIEAELAELPVADQLEYLSSYGLKESGLVRLITATYSLLGLMSFAVAVTAPLSPVAGPAKASAGALSVGPERTWSADKGGES